MGIFIQPIIPGVVACPVYSDLSEEAWSTSLSMTCKVVIPSVLVYPAKWNEAGTVDSFHSLPSKPDRQDDSPGENSQVIKLIKNKSQCDSVYSP